VHRLQVPEDQKHFLELNAELSEVWPVITEMKPHPEDWEDWKDVKNKLQHLQR
jgi:ferredoxin